MTKLTNVFTNQKEEKLRIVNNIELIGCIKNFCNYCATETNNDMSTLERHFINKLTPREVAVQLQMKEYENETDLKPTLRNIISNGYWAIEERDDYEIEEFMENFSDRDAYDIIKNYMVNTLNQVIEELEESAERKQEKAKANRIQSIRYSIQSSKDSIARLEAELKELVG